jgi:rhodanese-related sulfurtransferase
MQTANSRPRLKAVVAEASLVAVIGCAIALAANALSPRGLRLTRDYFPRADPAAAAAVARPAGASPVAPAAGPNATAAVVRRLEQRGLRVVSLDDASAWFRAGAAGGALVVFVDARDEARFATGHIPGAWPFDHYRPEKSLPAVLPLCLSAQKVVVYCAGGQCEDSEFAAVVLRDAGVPREKIFVLPGGKAEWAARGLPIETGPRGGSGAAGQKQP